MYECIEEDEEEILKKTKKLTFGHDLDFDCRHQ